jgi:hypothetical protein
MSPYPPDRYRSISTDISTTFCYINVSDSKVLGIFLTEPLCGPPLHDSTVVGSACLITICSAYRVMMQVVRADNCRV